MTLELQNETLLAILDHLVRNLGSSTLDVCFEDVDIHPDLEPLFDGMCRWALDEGLITVMSADHLETAHTETSYAHLHNPAITSLGVIVASTAMEHLDGNVVVATAMAKAPGLAHLARANGPAASALSKIVRAA